MLKRHQDPMPIRRVIEILKRRVEHYKRLNKPELYAELIEALESANRIIQKYGGL